MNLINYFIEANLALIVVALIYALFLKNETSFSLMRGFLLAGITTALLLPLIHFNFQSYNPIPTVSEVLPTLLLPELVVGQHGKPAEPNQLNLLQVVTLTYFIITLLLAFILVYRIGQLIKKITSSTKMKINEYLLIKSNAETSSFSFFQYIFIGKNNQFTEEEQNKIIQHERAHIQLHHSIDVLFIEIVQLLFWFNPAVYQIKRFLKDIHEYQADAATVNPHETDSYCLLMARMALLSIDFPIANHFNQSQTLKRITMINSPKTRPNRLKLTMICLMSVLFFIVIACQDQLSGEISEVAKNSTMALDIPEVVSDRVSFLKERNPNAELVVIELNEEGKKTFTNLEKKVKEANNYVLFEGVDVVVGKEETDRRRFVIFQYTSQASRIAELSSTNEVFTIVDQPAVPSMGIDQFYQMIGQQIQYPLNARKAKAEGKVFVEFIVNKDGSLSDFNIAKGFNDDCDAEAMRVLMLAQNWFPGKHQGKIVRQKMVMPITFQLEERTMGDAKNKTIKEHRATNSKEPGLVVIGIGN